VEKMIQTGSVNKNNSLPRSRSWGVFWGGGVVGQPLFLGFFFQFSRVLYEKTRSLCAYVMSNLNKIFFLAANIIIE